MTPPRTSLVALGLAAAMGILFVADLLTMAGFAHGMLYVLVVLIAMLLGQSWLVLSVAVGSSVLIGVGVLLSPPAPEAFPAQYVMANRLVSILVVLSAALLATALIRHQAARRRTELELLKTGRMLQMASEVAGIGGWSVDRNLASLHWTPEVQRIHGTSSDVHPTLEEAVGFYAPTCRERMRSAFTECVERGTAFDEECQIVNASGQTVWVRTVGRPLRNHAGAIVGAHGAFMDIDQSKRTARRLTTTLESITDALLLLDPEWRFTFVNARAEALLERPREQLVGNNLWEAFPAAVGTPFEREYRKARTTGTSVQFDAWYPPLKRWFAVHAYPSEEGLAVYFQDVTQQRKANEQLRLLEAAIGRINDIVLITEADPVSPPGPRIVYANNAFERLTGYSRAEILGRSPRILQGPDTQPEQLARIGAALREARPVRAELVNYTRDGRPYHIEIDIVPIQDDDGTIRHFVAVERDVTERLNLEEQLRQSQRLEAVGQLTGGIAHDFNNLLTVILGNAELLREELPADSGLAPVAEMMFNAARRGAELTQRLLAFARRQALEPHPVDVNRLVAHMEALLHRSLGNHIEIEFTRGGGLWKAMVDEGQLENAVLNLCLNARDAMATGGRLTIETANARLDREYTERHGDVEPGQYVMVGVSDTGRGIAPEHLDRVFEPFYTTKEKGRGTGLGLSMIYGFIKQSGGHITIYSERGEGTTVRMYLPRATETQEAARPPRPDPTPEEGTETVLLVEDDDLVRAFARDQLVSLGYRVLVASGGAQALELIHKHDDIDLLFTDVMMPGGMSGREVADAATALRPGLRVLYTSGYTENAVVHHGRLDPDVQLLSKPYGRAELARRIRAALGRPAPALGPAENPNDE